MWYHKLHLTSKILNEATAEPVNDFETTLNGN